MKKNTKLTGKKKLIGVSTNNFATDLSVIKVGLLMIFLLAFVSCNEDDEDDLEKKGNDQIELNLLDEKLRPLQVGLMSFENGQFSQQRYIGLVGEKEVDFHKVDANNLSFIVPEGIDAGKYAISLTIEDQEYKGEITVLPNEPVGNPDDVFSDFYEQILADELLSASNLNKMEDAIAEIGNLSETEKRQAAQVLVNNKVLLDQLSEELKLFSQNSSSEDRVQDCDKICKVGLGVGVIAAAIGAAPVVTVGAFGGAIFEDFLTPYLDGLMIKVNEALEAVYGFGYNRMAYTTELVYDKASNMISNVRTNELPDTIFLNEGEELGLSLQLIKTPLVSDQNRSEYPIIDELLNAVGKLKNLFEGSYEIVEAPEEEEVKIFVDDLDEFEVSVDNEHVQTSGLGGTPELAKISFQTERINTEYFNVTLSYTNDEDETTSFTQFIALEKEVKLVYLDGSGLTFPLEMRNNSPYAFKLVNGAGEDIEGFVIEKLDIKNVSNSEVYFQLQKNGIFGGGAGGEYFEVVPLTDLEEVEVTFDIYYDDQEVISVDALITNTNELILNGVTYTFMDGVLYDYANYNPIGEGTFSHYNYDFTIIDDEIELVTDEDDTYYDSDGGTIYLYVELFSPSKDAFQVGTFKFRNLDGLAEEDVAGDFFFEILSIEILQGENWIEYEAISGTVTVVHNGGLNYTLTYDVVVQQQNENDEFIGGTQTDIAFSYTGDFKYSDARDNDSSGRLIGNTKTKEMNFNQ